MNVKFKSIAYAVYTDSGFAGIKPKSIATASATVLINGNEYRMNDIKLSEALLMMLEQETCTEALKQLGVSI